MGELASLRDDQGDGLGPTVVHVAGTVGGTPLTPGSQSPAEPRDLRAVRFPGLTPWASVPIPRAAGRSR